MKVWNNGACRDKFFCGENGGVGFSALKKKLQNNPMCWLVWNMTCGGEVFVWSVGKWS
jgi:hypothetical protein